MTLGARGRQSHRQLLIQRKTSPRLKNTPTIQLR